ncbi:PH domain-containing protein [Paenibacillus macerans]|uniref:PH domain-containing protein n=1 Tax=Paenibacillus macerans TaxID=44252 RepID=UPI00203B982E|nr:PH domain-containing protein [Paenibacillus macerans]MCM3700314.1 PH domain-containing protein [Paenibacillus macerans]
MALFASGENREKHIQQLQEFLFEGEQIERTYGLSSNFVALTNKRLIYVGKIPLSKQTQVTTIPYSKIEEIGFEITGNFSLTNKINVTTRAGKHELEFDKAANIKEFYINLSRHIC